MINWIPFAKDSMPPDKTVVLVCGCSWWNENPHRWIDVANVNDGKLLACDDECEEVEDITHWAYADQINLPDSVPLYKAWARTPVKN